MDRETKRRLDDFRLTRAGELENELIDELATGTIDGQELLRHGALLCLSAHRRWGVGRIGCIGPQDSTLLSICAGQHGRLALPI